MNLNQLFEHCKNNILNGEDSRQFKEDIKAFMDTNEKLNRVDYRGLSLLHYAASFGQKEFFDILIQQGAQVTTRETESHSGTLTATLSNYKSCRSGERKEAYIYIIKKLLQAGHNSPDFPEELEYLLSSHLTKLPKSNSKYSAPTHHTPTLTHEQSSESGRHRSSKDKTSLNERLKSTKQKSLSPQESIHALQRQELERCKQKIKDILSNQIVKSWLPKLSEPKELIDAILTYHLALYQSDNDLTFDHLTHPQPPLEPVQALLAKACLGDLEIYEGIDELKKLIESPNENQPLNTHLYFAFTYLTWGDEFLDDAIEHLDLYREALNKFPQMYCPLYFMTGAWVAHLSKPQNISKDLFKTFLQLNDIGSHLKLPTTKADSHWAKIYNKLKALSETKTSQKQKAKNAQQSSPFQTRWMKLKGELESKGKSKLIEKADSLMQELLDLVGLQAIKKQVLDLCQMVLSDLDLPEKARVSRRLNFMLLGNPGTGKTTVAKLVGKLLHAIGVRKSETFNHKSAQELINAGAEDFEELIEDSLDGTLFIDEAYALSPKSNKVGQAIVDQILVAAEDHRDRLTLMLAGYASDIEEQLYGYNVGMKSRFQDWVLDDFSKDELGLIWEGLLKKYNPDDKGWRVEDENVSKIAINRIARGRGHKGFGNAREVRTVFEKAVTEAQQRGAGSPPTLKVIDLIGQEPNRKTLPKLNQVLIEMETQVGQAEIKKRVYDLIETARQNFQRELRGDLPHQIALNRIFWGNPGTGKTTFAKLYGRILKELRLLSHGGLIFKSASDFVGSAIGESQRKTKQLLELAKGKILVIDEAYVLNDSLYGKQALDTIVEKVSGAPGEDIAVVLCGYKEEISKMLRDQNPGLSRRFSVNQAFDFEDFSASELLMIAKRIIKASHLRASSLDLHQMVMLVDKKRAMPHFGNAGEIQTLISMAKERQSQRLSKLDSQQAEVDTNYLSRSDLLGEDEMERSKQDPFAQLKELNHSENIVEQFTKIHNRLQLWKHEGGRKPIIGHFVFLGNAGTGKTTVARAMGRLLHQLGVIARDHVEETSGQDLTGAYLGQTKGVVEEKLKAAAGGVLFIDEAYELGKGSYGIEAMTTLLRLMTEPKYDHDKTIIILAGYEHEMKQMMRINQGLSGRFKNRVFFQDWNAQSCLNMIQDLAKKEKFKLKLNEQDQMDLTQEFELLIQGPQWANARDVISIWEKVQQERADRLIQARDALELRPFARSTKKEILSSDINQALQTVIEQRGINKDNQNQDDQDQDDAMYLELQADEEQMLGQAQEQFQTEHSHQENQQEKENEKLNEASHSHDEEAHSRKDHSEKEQIKTELALLKDELNGLFKDLTDVAWLSKTAQNPKHNFETYLEDLAQDDPNFIANLHNKGLDHELIQQAMEQMISRLIDEGKEPDQAQKTVEREVKKFLKSKKRAEQLKEKINQLSKKLEAIYICGVCRRPWGVCTYMGPVLQGYRWKD